MTSQLATQAPTQYVKNPHSRYPSLRDELENGEFLLCPFGRAYSFGFHGPPDFIWRAYAFCQNRSIISRSATLHWFHGANGPLAYVITTKERILAGLKSQFRGEIVTNREVPLIRDEWLDGEEDNDPCVHRLEIDEEKVNSLAAERAYHFLTYDIINDPLMMTRASGIAPVYEVREERGEGIEE